MFPISLAWQKEDASQVSETLPWETKPSDTPFDPLQQSQVHIQPLSQQHLPGILTSAGCHPAPISSALVEASGPLNGSLSVLDLTSIFKKLQLIQEDFDNVF